MCVWELTYRGMVYPWHCDHMGHMNVMWYTGKFDEACWQLLAMLGVHRTRMAQDDTAVAAIEQRTQYKRELHAGDAITIQSAILEITDKTIHMLHKMVHEASGEVVATTAVVGVYMDAIARRAIQIPDDIRERALNRQQREMASLLTVGE